MLGPEGLVLDFFFNITKDANSSDRDNRENEANMSRFLSQAK